MEMQAVIFCGGAGNRMPQLCQRNAKCFLPVGGVPMFWFPLATAIRSGLRDILLVIQESHRLELDRHLRNPVFDIPGCVKIDHIYIEKDNEDWGTADVLRSIAHRINKDVVLMSGDFVTDGSIAPVIDQFRAYKTDLSIFVSDHCLTGPEPGPKIKKSKGRDMIGYVEDTNHIVFLASEDDFDRAVNALPWMEKFPKINMTANLNDCHVYVMKRKHLEVLLKQKKMSSIKADLVPYLLEQQNLTSTNVKCMLYNQLKENGQVCAHANNLPAYFEISKAIIKVLPGIMPKASPQEVFAGRVIKRSFIGSHCHISEGAKVENSLLMEGVHIGKNAIVSNTILCSNVVVEEGAKITNCLVLNGQRITSAKVQNEVVDEGDEISDAWTEDH